MKQKKYLAAVLLLFFGLYFNFLRHMPDMQKSIFGDDGDGLFTLWLLENLRYFLSNLDVSQFVNTNSFYPENHLALFWSDTMIFPGFLYTVFFCFCRNQILSYNLLTFTAVSSAFVVHFVFFRTIIQWAQEKLIEQKILIETPLREFFSSILLLLFTYSYTFSMTRMVYTVHFQNQWSFLVILALVGMFKIFEKSYKMGSALICISFTLLCLSSMYFAMVLGLLGALFFICVCFYFTKFEFIKFFKQFLPFGLLTLCFTSPILYGYFLTQKNDLHPGGFAKVYHLFIPLPESFLYEFFHKYGVNLGQNYPFNHEVLLYIGIFLLILAIPVFCYCIMQAILFLKNEIRLKKLFYKILILNISAWLIPNHFVFYHYLLKPFFTTFSLGIFFLFVFYCIFIAMKKHVLRPGLALLVIFAMIFYGICFGRSVAFSQDLFNPSLFGVLSLFNPWMNALRAAGRFGVLATGMLSAMTLYFVMLKAKLYKPIIGIALIGLLLAHTFEQNYHPYVNTYELDRFLKPAEKERSFFSTLEGLVVFYPVNPWHKNTYYQLLSLPYRNIHLVNGYSASSSSLFSKIMANSAKENIPDARVLEILKGEGIQVFVFSKSAYDAQKLKVIRQTFSSIVFESENFLACALR